MIRREFIALLLATGGILVAGTAGATSLLGGKKDKELKKEESFPFRLSDAEWKKKLSPEQYNVLRQEGTERSGTSPLNEEKREGVFHCAGCDHPLYSSEHKYESGTGWPSFYQPINDAAVGTSEDRKLFYVRTEIHCANCGSHLGHVFDDGPKPTGLRYCMNGVALSFKPS